MKHAFICIFLTLTVSGCTTFYAQQNDVADQINQWLAGHEYDRVLTTIRAMSVDHPAYPSLIETVPAIEEQRQQFIYQVLADAKKYESTQDWVSAQALIRQGLSRLPEAPELLAQEDYYQQKREKRLAMDDAAILIAKARYIIHAHPFQESRLYNAEQSASAQQQFNRFLDEAQQVSRELYALGQRYWRNEQLTQAREALNLSIQTASNELSAELLAQIQELEKEQRSIARDRQQKAASEQLPQLTANFYEQLNAGDFRGAENLLREIESVHSNEGAALRETMLMMKQARIESLIASGDNLYNSGYVEQAANRWMEVLQLAPDNTEVASKLDRAEKFLGNLERWSDNGESDSPSD